MADETPTNDIDPIDQLRERNGERVHRLLAEGHGEIVFQLLKLRIDTLEDFLFPLAFGEGAAAAAHDLNLLYETNVSNWLDEIAQAPKIITPNGGLTVVKS